MDAVAKNVPRSSACAVTHPPLCSQCLVRSSCTLTNSTRFTQLFVITLTYAVNDVHSFIQCHKHIHQHGFFQTSTYITLRYTRVKKCCPLLHRISNDTQQATQIEDVWHSGGKTPYILYSGTILTCVINKEPVSSHQTHPIFDTRSQKQPRFDF